MVTHGCELKCTSWAKEKRHPYCPFPTPTLPLTSISCTALSQNITIFTRLIQGHAGVARTEVTLNRQMTKPLWGRFQSLLVHSGWWPMLTAGLSSNYWSMLEPITRQLLGLVLYLLLTYRKWLGRSWTTGGLFGLNKILLHPVLAL